MRFLCDVHFPHLAHIHRKRAREGRAHTGQSKNQNQFYLATGWNMLNKNRERNPIYSCILPLCLVSQTCVHPFFVHTHVVSSFDGGFYAFQFFNKLKNHKIAFLSLLAEYAILLRYAIKYMADTRLEIANCIRFNTDI